MKVILNKDHKDLGKSGALVEVSEGFARNFLFPRSLAAEATPSAMKQWEERKKAEERREAKLLAEAQANGLDLQESTVTLTAKSGEGGRIYGSITTKEIAAAITKQTKHEVDKRKIELDEAIKALGTHNITVKLHPKVTVKMKVSVVEE